MSTIKEIEAAVSKLSNVELATFRNWFIKFDAEVWNRQFEEDAATGRLDTLANEAISDLRNGSGRPEV